MQNNEMTVKASVLTVLICILFGANTVAIKFALTGLGGFTAAGIRFALAALAIYGWARFKKIPLKLTGKQLKQVGILGAIFAVQLSCFYQGLARITASHGVLIANILPFVVLILAHFFIPGDNITLKKSVGITFGFVGVLFLLLDDQNLSGDLKTGDAIVLLAVMLWSSSAVYVKTIIEDFHPVQITLYPISIATPFFFIAAFFWDSPMIIQVNGTVMTAVFYQSFISASIGFLIWNSLLARFGATSLHSFVFIMPLVGVLFSVLLLGEIVTPYLAASIGFIVAGVIIVNWHRRKRKIVSAIEPLK